MSDTLDSIIFIVYEVFAILLMLFTFYCFLFMRDFKKSIDRQLKQLKEQLSYNYLNTENTNKVLVDMLKEVHELHSIMFSKKTDEPKEITEKETFIKELQREYSNEWDDYSSVNFTVSIYSNNIDSVKIYKEMQKELEANFIFISLNELNRLMSLKEKTKKGLYLKSLHLRVKKRLQSKK